jgi:hypothetical protein
VRDAIEQEAGEGHYDLIVLGAPLPDREGRISLDGLVGQVLGDVPDRAALIVRSNYTTASVSMLVTAGRIHLVEEDVL